MIIRQYQQSDTENILNILDLNTPEYFSPNERKDLIYYLDNYAQNYYVVEIGDELVGCGGFNLSEDCKTGKISWDIIRPQKQGLGIGTELTKYRIREMKKINSIIIISVRTSQLVYPFYEKFGLEIREIVKDYWDKGFDLYRLDCSINSVLI